MDPVPTLTDGTVILRAHRPDDAEGSYEQSIDPVSRRWTTVPVPYTREHARSFVSERMPAGWVDGSAWGFAVEVEGRYAGTVELRDEGEGRLEVAYGSHPWVRGSGTMERAVRMLVDWGFADRGARVVIWRANKGNWASRKLAWRLGFTVEGTIRQVLPQRGELRDAWVGTLLATDDREPKGRWLEVPVLEADGLRLRPFRESDVPRIVEACGDARTQHWLGQIPDPYQEADAQDWLEHQRENRATGQAVQWAVVDAADDERVLAAMNCFGIVPEVECEVGYWAHPDARGRGVVTRAMREVVRYAFEDLGVRRVTAGAATENTASRHVIEANGLTAWGTERLGATVRAGRADIVWYDVLVEEWRRSRRF
ncbi:MAG TPA: GNAT family N-acetyltransferase [Nocardioides sp.]|jgi:RimJ/RimL family protein N-acetyltransferase|nr:GNAT family N-acetyltransferase [Nocardioides sp.]